MCILGASLVVALTVLSGCGALGDTEVRTSLFDMKADQAVVTYQPPGHCTNPGYRLALHPGDGVTLTLQDTAGGGATLGVQVQLAVSRGFQFVSDTAQVTLQSGASPVPVPLPDFWFRAKPGALNSSARADDLLSGPAPNSPAAPPTPLRKTEFLSARVYDADLRLGDQVGANARFTLQLPDAIVNGQRIALPPIDMARRELGFTHDACLR